MHADGCRGHRAPFAQRRSSPLTPSRPPICSLRAVRGMAQSLPVDCAVRHRDQRRRRRGSTSRTPVARHVGQPSSRRRTRVTHLRNSTACRSSSLAPDAFARTRRCARAPSRGRSCSSPKTRLGLDGGGIINFIEVNRNLRFEISLNAADRSGLKINSRCCQWRRASSAGRRARSVASIVIQPTALQFLPHQGGQA